MVLVHLISLLWMITIARGQTQSSAQNTAAPRFNQKLEGKQYEAAQSLKKEIDPACKDTSPICYAIDASYCHEAPLKTYCKATCGYCPKGVPQVSIRPVPGDCKDLDPLCYTYKDYCAGTIWVQHYCQKSCGLCYDAPDETQYSAGGYSTLASGASGKSNSPCECGIANDPSSTVGHSSHKNRIVGGHEALKNKYPWMVSVLIGHGDFGALCGGSIINTRYVLTAGHCTWKGKTCTNPFQAKDFTVSVADFNIRSMNDDIPGVTERVGVIEVHRHPEYCLDPRAPTLFNNDLTILKLEKDLDFSHKELGFPCLPDEPNANYDGKKAVVAGWGYDLPQEEIGHALPDKLQEVEFNVYHDCRAYKYRQHLTVNMICAGNTNEVKDACEGDSGGPLMHQEENGRYTQIGLVSFGPPGGNCTGIGVYTNLAHYVEWIKLVTRDSQCPTGIAKPKKITPYYKTQETAKG